MDGVEPIRCFHSHLKHLCEIHIDLSQFCKRENRILYVYVRLEQMVYIGTVYNNSFVFQRFFLWLTGCVFVHLIFVLSDCQNTSRGFSLECIYICESYSFHLLMKYVSSNVKIFRETEVTGTRNLEKKKYYTKFNGIFLKTNSRNFSGKGKEN